ncbi:Jag family protein [Zhihengliuella salsuginis]|uniref:Single-stranded DNA-binding protein n=1 Tax=Zhihengliuella salsuginis TaxID=578222 RepID=A0ABQ3GJY6_9MICC|nr:R3H domain-containing nucleic acid-binding protein [Zhihengliuella salsuginis]GHD11365.1 single-stranded DNA-binding protein [Zhihengliuella salsuginis]
MTDTQDAAEVTEVEESAPARPEEEGDIAADYLEELLDIADIDGDIDIEVRSGRTYISIVQEEGDESALRELIGHDGDGLDALQELTRLAVLTQTGNRSRLILDILDYRKGRSAQLKKIAEDAAERARDSGENIPLEAMSAYERKQVHDFIAELGLHSESDGEGSRRHVVVSAA